jgi:replicative DNA helicase
MTGDDGVYDQIDQLSKKRIEKLRGQVSDDEDVSSVDVLLELSARRMVDGSFVLDAPEMIESLWGSGHEALWARGESFLICGPDGVGKTTLVQQLALAIAGIGEPEFLGLPVAPGERRVLYLACDRPTQARRSLGRMVGEPDRDLLTKRFVIWRGPLPFDLARNPEALTALARRAECDVVIIDSLKDVASDLSKEETGTGLNTSFQLAVTEGIEVLALHHQRKALQGGGKPRMLSDVYGSRWLTAGCGSVVMLWGEAGDPFIELTHLKQPDEPVGPLIIVHDHVAGRSKVADHVDAYTEVLRSPSGATPASVATAIYGSADRNSTEKARRKLERLANEGKIHRSDPSQGGRGQATISVSI